MTICTGSSIQVLPTVTITIKRTWSQDVTTWQFLLPVGSSRSGWRSCRGWSRSARPSRDAAATDGRPPDRDGPGPSAPGRPPSVHRVGDRPGKSGRCPNATQERHVVRLRPRTGPPATLTARRRSIAAISPPAATGGQQDTPAAGIRRGSVASTESRRTPTSIRCRP